MTIRTDSATEVQSPYSLPVQDLNWFYAGKDIEVKQSMFSF